MSWVLTQKKTMTMTIDTFWELTDNCQEPKELQPNSPNSNLRPWKHSPNSLTINLQKDCQSESGLYYLTFKEWPRDLWPMRHLIIVMKKYDLTNILKFFDNFYNFWQFWQFLTTFAILTILTNLRILRMLTICDNFGNLWQFATILVIYDNLRQFLQFWQFFVDNFLHCWQLLTIFTLLTIVDIFLTIWQLWQFWHFD